MVGGDFLSAGQTLSAYIGLWNDPQSVWRTPITAISPVLAGVNAVLRASAPVLRGTPIQITYELTSAGPVRLTVHDLQGRMDTELVNHSASAGHHSVVWGGPLDKMGCGAYFLRLTTSTTVRWTKIILF